MTDTLEISVLVKNTGKVSGEEVVQLYTRDLVASLTRPVKELKGFQKIELQAGESKEVRFKLTSGELSFFNGRLEDLAEPGEFELFVGSSSSTRNKNTFTLIN